MQLSQPNAKTNLKCIELFHFLIVNKDRSSDRLGPELANEYLSPLTAPGISKLGITAGYKTVLTNY